MMAAGGIVNKATKAIIGEAGPEAVMPLSKLSSMIASLTKETSNQSVTSDNKSVKNTTEFMPGPVLGTENLHREMQRLNTQIAEAVKYLKDTADNTDKTHRATKALNGNAFA